MTSGRFVDIAVAGVLASNLQRQQIVGVLAALYMFRATGAPSVGEIQTAFSSECVRNKLQKHWRHPDDVWEVSGSSSRGV